MGRLSLSAITMPVFQLQSLTTKYSEAHDRLCLRGVCEDNRALCMWLTQRLANRLVNNLANWLGEQAPDAGVAQSGIYDSRNTGELITGPVHEWLVVSIRLKFEAQSVEMAFYDDGTPGACGKIRVSQEQTLQWLGILRNQFFLAEWSTSQWPEAIQSPAVSVVTRNETLH